MRLRLLYLCLLLVARVEAQESPQVSATMEQILRRLDGLEKQNQQLMDEVRSLREQVAASRATAGDVVAEAAKEGQATQGQPTAQQPTLDERVTRYGASDSVGFEFRRSPAARKRAG
jgi:predicted  nucleic acid-binding Zn-ribbon protein